MRPTRHARQILIVCIATVAVVAAVPQHSLSPGMTFTIHTKKSVVGGGGAMTASTEAGPTDWTGNVMWTAGCGRMDVVAGGQANTFTKGDYVLFDSTDYIVVHPRDKTFTSMPDIAARLKQATDTLEGAQKAAGIHMLFKNVKVTVDTLGSGGAVGGQATQRFRLNAAYTMVIDMGEMAADLGGFAPPPMESKITIDYWLADGVGLPPNPLVGSLSGGPGATQAFGAMMKDVFDKMAAAMTALPTGKVALRTTTSTRVSSSSQLTSGSDDTTEVSGIKNADVSPERLVLPNGFSETPMKGLEVLFPTGAPLSKDGGAKWRKRPDN